MKPVLILNYNLVEDTNKNTQNKRTKLKTKSNRNNQKPYDQNIYI